MRGIKTHVENVQQMHSVSSTKKTARASDEDGEQRKTSAWRIYMNLRGGRLRLGWLRQYDEIGRATSLTKPYALSPASACLSGLTWLPLSVARLHLFLGSSSTLQVRCSPSTFAARAIGPGCTLFTCAHVNSVRLNVHSPILSATTCNGDGSVPKPHHCLGISMAVESLTVLAESLLASHFPIHGSTGSSLRVCPFES
ncbi:hypothetical protein BD309DRAFT_657461 [Dichomitus squalens]|nr:hypothetical protein BD309DRAFT_657461 [Dichomitus squalens]